MKISNLRHKLLIGAGYVVFLFFVWQLKLPCLFLTVFRFPCPGCGMTRAMAAALRLDFGEAFRYHPMFWSMPLLALHLLLDGGLFRNKWANTVFLILLGAGFLINWLF